MRILLDEHNRHKYAYHYLEVAQQVWIYKDDEHLYSAYLKDNKWWCDCPGAVYHQHCHHEAKCTLAMQQPRCAEPWTLWAEEAAVMTVLKEI